MAQGRKVKWLHRFSNCLPARPRISAPPRAARARAVMESSRGAARPTTRRRSPILCMIVIAPPCMLLALLRHRLSFADADIQQAPLALHNITPGTSKSESSYRLPSIRGLWQVGKLNMSLDFNLDDIAARVLPDAFAAVDSSVRLHSASASGMPLRIVPRAPKFLLLSRPSNLPLAPEGSMHLDRPPGAEGDQPTTPSCLFTHEAALGRASFARRRDWTLEAVVLFLDNSHFSGQWQTIIGRNGHQMSPDPGGKGLSSLALKLSPDLSLLLQAFLAPAVAPGQPPQPTRHVSAWSKHRAQANAWYHIVVVARGGRLELYVNGMLEISSEFDGWLADPPRSTDGDLTFGCGMHGGVLADTCSCLLSEVRASDRALPSQQWLWSPGGAA